MEHFGRYAQLEELINDTPEFRAKLEEGGISLADSRATLAQLGVKAPKRSVESKTTAIGPNGLLVQDTDTRTGQTTERVVSGTPKTPAKTGSVGALQQSVSAIKGLVDDGDITEAEGQARILSLLDKSTTGTKAQGLAKGGGSGGGKGGAAGQSLKEREQDRKELKDKFDRADKAADNAKAAADAAQAALRDHTREGAPRGKGSAVDAYNAGLAELKSAAKEARAKADTARKRADDMNTELDKPPAEPAKQPAGGKGAVLKFDKNGNRI